jgi:hypothetical protein
LREECRLRVFENKVLKRIFGPKRDEVTGEWRRLHSKKLYALYFSPNDIAAIKTRRRRWAGLVARMDKGRDTYWVLVGKAEGWRRRWEDNTEIDLREVGWWHGLDRSGSG